MDVKTNKKGVPATKPGDYYLWETNDITKQASLTEGINAVLVGETGNRAYSAIGLDGKCYFSQYNASTGFSPFEEFDFSSANGITNAAAMQGVKANYHVVDSDNANLLQRHNCPINCSKCCLLKSSWLCKRCNASC